MSDISVIQELQEAEHELEQFGYKQELKRSLGVGVLTAYGLNYMIPLAPAVLFGVQLTTSGGTVAIPYIFAAIAMFFTASSYAAMVRVYPLAGSVYNYLSRGWTPYAGFLAGWGILLDYLLIPGLVTTVGTYWVQQLLPSVPFIVILAIIAIFTGVVNYFGVEIMARIGLWFLGITGGVVVLGFGVWIYAVVVNHVGTGTLFSAVPFKSAGPSALLGATALSVLSYLGFDAITTLAEETVNPKRDIPRAIYLTLFIGALLFSLTGYLGMLPIADWAKHASDNNWVSATLFFVAKDTGGTWFSLVYTAGFIFAVCVFNVVATSAGARLLFGMGRDELIPKPVFTKLNKWEIPHFNVILIVLLIFVCGLWLNIDLLSSMVNFGALLGFILINAVVIVKYCIKDGDDVKEAREKSAVTFYLRYLITPLIGIGVNVWIFTSLDPMALRVGAAWVVLGLILLAIKTAGFRRLPPSLDV